MLKRDLKASFLHVHVHLSSVAQSEQTPWTPKVLVKDSVITIGGADVGAIGGPTSFGLEP